jgi:ABC-2 type transport system ATP-binding protein
VDANAEPQPAIDAADVEKSFAVRGWVPGRPKRVVHALRGASITVGPATVHGIMGPNGSGKSTLLRVLATLIVPDGGRASVGGFDTATQARDVRATIGFSTGDERSLYWRLSAQQNLEFAAALYRVQDVNAAIERALALVDLEGERSRPVSGFSQGMARRLGLARALLHEPRILLLDEPTRSLDPAARHEFHEVLLRLRADGVTTLLTTHDSPEAVAVCDRVSLLSSGRFVDELTPDADDSDALDEAVQRVVR